MAAPLSYQFIPPVQSAPQPAGPDPKWHTRVSMVKSGLRIFAAFTLASGSLTWAGALLLVAELLGIAEEMV